MNSIGALASSPARWRTLIPLALLAGLVIELYPSGGRAVALLLIGTLLGLTLYLSSFSFTSAYRRLLLFRQPNGVIAQLTMIALTSVLFAPLLEQGKFAGVALTGAWAPVGWQVAIGALLFGIGMQLAGGCGSGTLYTTGGGSPRMLLVLIAFCAGSFWASLHMSWWQALPQLGVVSLGHRLGWTEAVVLQLAVLGLITALLCWWGRSKAIQPPRTTTHYSLLWGVLFLALLNLATLITAGHPWTITWAFSLWGAKVASINGWVAAEGSFWSAPFQSQALADPLLNDSTSLMNIGILLGAASAALISDRFRTSFKHTRRQWLSALLGGLLLGYSARIAYGCNIGAFVSGIASTSLHGWLWIACALPGNWIGIKIRPWFGLSNS